jgi:hypothetical protein
MQRHEEAALARLAAPQLGLASTADAAGVGMSDDQLWRLRKAGLVIPVHRGVVLHAASTYDHDTRLLAAVMACGDALVSHRSAAMLHGYEVRRYRPELLAVGTVLPKLADAAIHRTTQLDDVDRTVVRGIPCTSRARTALDLFGVLPYEVVQDVLQTAVVSGLLTYEELVAVLDRVGRRGRPGTAGLRAFVATAVPDDRLDRKLELLLDRLLALCVGVPPGIVQHPVVGADGNRYVLDRAWPDLGVAIEVDGHRWHATKRHVDRDRTRRRAITATGLTLYVYGWADLHDRAAATQAEIESIFRSLCP